MFYSLFLNVASIGCFVFVVLAFPYERGLSYDEVMHNINLVFSHTDIVAILGFFIVLEAWS